MINWSSLRNLFSLATTLQQAPEQPDGNALLENFIAHCQAMPHPRVLELGTMRSIPTRATRHDDWVPHAGQYLGTDIAPGPDVDIVADVHRLTQTVGEQQFDIIISCSTFEHFKYPHLAAHEVMKALKIGGILFIQTHQTFPLHSYPYDYCRFSQETARAAAHQQMGTLANENGASASQPARCQQDAGAPFTEEPSFLNVRLYGEKIAQTPPHCIFDFDIALADSQPQPEKHL